MPLTCSTQPPPLCSTVPCSTAPPGIVPPRRGAHRVCDNAEHLRHEVLTPPRPQALCLGSRPHRPRSCPARCGPHRDTRSAPHARVVNRPAGRSADRQAGAGLGGPAGRTRPDRVPRRPGRGRPGPVRIRIRRCRRLPPDRLGCAGTKQMRLGCAGTKQMRRCQMRPCPVRCPRPRVSPHPAQGDQSEAPGVPSALLSPQPSHRPCLP